MDDVIKTLEGVGSAAADMVTARFRSLTTDEINEAYRVYQSTIRYDLVVICDNIGLNNRPFTIPISGPLDAYRINLGKLGFAGTSSVGLRSTLIHELCHVWQGQHDPIAWSYVVNSLVNQAVLGNDAYTYTSGHPWMTYNAEQQAQIVEDWYSNGLSPNDPLFRYIRNHIWSPYSGLLRSLGESVGITT